MSTTASERISALREDALRLVEPAPIEIPAGKVLLAEYSDVNDSNRARRTVLEEREVKGRTYRLVRSSPGFEPAGSVARWTNGYYAVWFELGGARQGRQFRTEFEARGLFEAWVARREAVA